MAKSQDLAALARLVRYFILTSTTEAGSGHPSSSLSATDLMSTLFFRYLRYDGENPNSPLNDRVIFSKGHAAPLLYALYAAAGLVEKEELLTLRKYKSPFQGHPTPAFRYADVATGSLGQGLSIGLGMALNAKYLDKLHTRVFVLLGDGEAAEGQVWEAVQIASHYKLDNLVGILDVNRWGQSQETMLGHDVKTYANRLEAFGWHTEQIDGHSIPEIENAFEKVLALTGKPKMIVAKTIKAKGISIMEDKDGWHGKVLLPDQLKLAIRELGEVNLNIVGQIEKPSQDSPARKKPITKLSRKPPDYSLGEKIATRQAYGRALSMLVSQYPEMVILDADVKNSTFTELVVKSHPDRFFEMYIAEQNMIGAALGLAKMGKIPFVSTFAAFLTRAFDQLRLAAISGANIGVAGSHVGVSIGEDGPSQMGLEDIAMFRTLHNSTIFYPCDAVSTHALVEQVIQIPGIVYLRLTRPATPVIYNAEEKFQAGGSKVLRSADRNAVTLVGAGVTLHEALTAHNILAKDGVQARVIDCYSIKPLDEETLTKAAEETKAIFVIEDHWAEGGLGDALLNLFASGHPIPIFKLAVREMPGSGQPRELLDGAGISAQKIVEAVRRFLKQ